MNDPYHIVVEQARQQWRASSILLSSQINDMDALAKRLKTPWMSLQIRNQIDFLIDLNNSVDDYVDNSTRLITLLKFEKEILNETIQAYATKDSELFTTIIQKLKK